MSRCGYRDRRTSVGHDPRATPDPRRHVVCDQQNDAVAYADQDERDYAALGEAVPAGRVTATPVV
jgi:hypothetical protein